MTEKEATASQEAVVRPAAAAAAPSTGSSSSALDRFVITATLAVLVCFCLLIPPLYVSQLIGVDLFQSALSLCHYTVFRTQHTVLGRQQPIAAALARLAEMLPQPPHAHRRQKSSSSTGATNAAAENSDELIDEDTGRPVKELIARDDAVLALYAHDPSYVRYQDSAIFFRVLPRKVPISSKTGEPTLRFLYQLMNGDRSRLAEATLKLNEEKEQEDAAVQELAGTYGTGEALQRRKRKYVQSYGMAEIDYRTNELRKPATDGGAASAGDVAVPCVHAGSKIHAHYIDLTANGAHIVKNSYAFSEPGDVPVLTLDMVRPCVQRVLPMMCVGDKWEVVCPRNMTRQREIGGFDSLLMRIDIRDVEGPHTTLADAQDRLARGVYWIPRGGEEASHIGEDGLYTRAALLASAKLAPPRVAL